MTVEKNDYSFFLTVIPGLELATHLELCSKWEQAPDFFSLPPYPKNKIIRGGVEFQAPLQWGFELCRLLRTPTRLLLRLGKFDASNEKAMASGLKGIPWGDYFKEKTYFDFKFTSKSSKLSSNNQIKSLLEKTLKKHKVLYKKGAIQIYVRVFRDQCELSLDCIGADSFKRKEAKGSIASLRNTTAAGLINLLLQGVNEPYELIDPMCGAGTFLYEAINRDQPIERDFNFEKFPAYEEIELTANGVDGGHYFYGFDKSEKAVKISKDNLPQKSNIIVQKSDLFDKEKGKLSDRKGKRIAIVNPPWGKRLPGSQSDPLKAIYEKYQPDRMGFLMPARWKFDKIPLEKVRDIPILNSGVENRFLIFA